MITITPAQGDTIILTEEEFNALIPQRMPLSADLREQMRVKLRRLPIVARAVYDRDNIHDPDTPLLDVVRTVLYHFDQNNFELVAEKLDLLYGDLQLLLVGVILGREELRG